jgi:isoleucyl-tRNA synthetase
MGKPFFNPVDLKINFSEMEIKLMDYWYKNGIVKKYLDRNKNSDKIFSFLDGPITSNNPMGVHHAWGRTYKDLWQRYKNMQGFKQRFQNGFDCQGLWVEVEVEKELGLKNKKEIENLVTGDSKASIAKFVDLCKKRAIKYSDIQTEQSKRLGYFMDWDHSYYTLSDNNNFMIWNFLKKCHEKGLIYKGRDSVPWCPRCGTAISQHEILTEDYKELTHETVFLKFPIKNREYCLLVWTTTPWTIPGNVALAVNPNFIYSEWENVKTKEFIIVVRDDEIAEEEEYKNFVESIFGEGEWNKVKDYKGQELVGLQYEAPFDQLPKVQKAKKLNPDKFHTVLGAEDLVVATKGTGILHVAPGQGEEDFQLGKNENLPVIDLINEEADYYEDLGELSFKNAKKHPEIILDYLRLKDDGKYLFKTSRITHRYPACWRCKTELVWRVVDEWYIKIDPLREDMKRVAEDIKWIPEFGLKRELDWLKNMHDWLISKKRYWGLALPIWECKKCGNFKIIGGIDELKKEAVEGWEKFEGHSPHRPWIDEVKIRCNKCGEIAERVHDVGNPWLDAGIVPFSTITKDNIGKPLYWEDRNKWLDWFPSEFITESFPGQFKNWFYSLIAMSTVMENQKPFRTVLGFATLLSENGKPMHKSSGNMIEFNEGADKIGVDVMRWMYLIQNPSENLIFGYKVADQTRRRFHLKLWNVYNFFVTYANLDGWTPKTKKPKSINKNVLDKWILLRLDSSIKNVSERLDNYDAYSASFEIEKFVDDLSNWYIRRSRSRVGPASENLEDRDYFYITCFFVLVNLSKMLAPFIPFLADEIFQNLTKENSIHLTTWPIQEAKVKQSDLKLLDQIEKIRNVIEKVHAKRKIEGITVRQPLRMVIINTMEFTDFSKDLISLAEDELNVKKLKFIKGEESIVLDVSQTPDLIEEAKVRELIRSIQDRRKLLNVSLSDKIDVISPWIPNNLKQRNYLIKKTLTKNLSKGENFSVKKSSKS